MKPINTQLNVAVMHIAGRLFPRGFDVTDEGGLIGTLDDICSDMREGDAPGKRFHVWRGASENTAFADPDVNHAFRAWHDWAHCRYNLAFTPEGEAQAAAVQALHIVQLYGHGDDAARMVAQLFAEVVGQTRFKESHGDFPAEQHEFVAGEIGLYMGAARRFCRMIEARTRPTYAHERALGFAEHGYIVADVERFATTAR